MQERIERQVIRSYSRLQRSDGKLRDGSQPQTAFDLWVCEAVGRVSLDRLVRRKSLIAVFDLDPPSDGVSVLPKSGYALVSC
jgi:hypothetical protein